MSETIQSQQEKLLALLENNQTLALATLNKAKEAEASATPYIYHNDVFWIFVSQLSSHTENLIQHKKASILIADTNSPNIFASTRATIQCDAQIEIDNKESILDLMTEQLGETVDMLRQLPDFYLIKLAPISGQFISGFGSAFRIHFPDCELKHIGPQ